MVYFPLKKKQPDYFKFIPIAVMAVSFISGYTLLQADASQSKEKIKAIEVVQTKMSGDISDVKVSQAKTETQIQVIYEIGKDLKKK